VDESYEAELARLFEVAAVRALRVPVLTERSARLRHVARLVVPERARPVLRRLASVVDALLRRAFELVEAVVERR
jgi:hypothetical protein